MIERDYGKYTVRVDQEVPCGMTQEPRRRIPAKLTLHVRYVHALLMTYRQADIKSP